MPNSKETRTVSDLTSKIMEHNMGYEAKYILPVRNVLEASPDGLSPHGSTDDVKLVTEF